MSQANVTSRQARHFAPQGGVMNRSPVSRRRRQVLQGAGAATALGALGFPAIVRSQSDAIRFGHLTPRTGFLGPLGEYAVMGVNARRRGNQCRRRHHGAQDRADRRGQRQSADGVDQGGATDRARQGRRDHRRDQLGIGPCHRAGRAAQQDHLLQHRLQLRRAPRQGLQSLHVPHRSGEHDVRVRRRDRRTCATAWSRARSGTA